MPPLLRGRVWPDPARAGLKPARTLRLSLRPGARVESVARPTLALGGYGSRLCPARVEPEILCDRLRLRLRRSQLLAAILD